MAVGNETAHRLDGVTVVGGLSLNGADMLPNGSGTATLNGAVTPGAYT